jgi:hypothetical protein
LSLVLPPFCLQEVQRAMFDLLLAHGADVNLAGALGCTPVMLAVDLQSRHKAQWLLGP